MTPRPKSKVSDLTQVATEPGGFILLCFPNELPPKASAQLGTVNARATVMGEGQSKERAILGWKLSGSLMSPLPGPSPVRGGS